jgi:REP element-mobilizing transposase RayT
MQKRIKIYGFVIMPTHFHILYDVIFPFTNGNIKQSLLGFTSKEILKNMTEDEKSLFLVEKTNRQYQIWKSPSLSVAIFSLKFFYQKLNYIHNNPKKADLVKCNADYKLCSFNSYKARKSEFDFLTLMNF